MTKAEAEKICKEKINKKTYDELKIEEANKLRITLAQKAKIDEKKY